MLEWANLDLSHKMVTFKTLDKTPALITIKPWVLTCGLKLTILIISKNSKLRT